MFVNGLIVRRHRSAFQVVRTDTVIRGLILSTGAKRRCKQGFSTIVCGRPPHQACRPRELPAKTVRCPNSVSLTVVLLQKRTIASQPQQLTCLQGLERRLRTHNMIANTKRKALMIGAVSDEFPAEFSHATDRQRFHPIL